MTEHEYVAAVERFCRIAKSAARNLVHPEAGPPGKRFIEMARRASASEIASLVLSGDATQIQSRLYDLAAACLLVASEFAPEGDVNG